MKKYLSILAVLVSLANSPMVEAARRDDPIPVPSKPQEIIIDMNCIGTDWPEYLAQYVVKYHTQVKTYSYTDEACINTLSQYNRRDLNVGYPSEKYRVIKKIESTVRELELEALLRP